MNSQPTSEQGDVQTAVQAVEACAHLSPGEKAALLSAIGKLEKQVLNRDLQVQRLAANEQAQINVLEKALTELAEQKAMAEALKRELQIEVALEKIRARAMAMLQADELYEVVTLVLEKLQELGITMQARSAFIAVFDESKKELIEWVASPEHTTSLRFTTPYINHPVSASVWEARKRGEDFISRSFTVEEKNSYFDYYFQHVCCTNQLDHVKQLVYASDYYAYYIAFEKNSAIGISSFSGETLAQDEIMILKRFARVFEQAYIRFLDLQKSEAQAREAKIEAALERLRSRTMAMQNSRDVGDAIGMLFTELEKLGMVTLRCGVFVIEEETKMLEVWTAASTPEGRVGQMGGRFSFNIHPMLEGAFQAWKQKKDFYSYELAGEELLNYFKILLAANPTYNLPSQNLQVDRQFSYGFFFNDGALFTFTAEPHTAEHIAVMKRFAVVFGLTYRRYLDLKIAEEQTRQTIRQASIDRLRAEIASMRSAEDLQHITPLLWRELHALRVSFVRCGVFIVNESAGSIHAYLSTPQGQSRGLLKMQIDENDHTRLLLDNWRRQVVYNDHWNREQLISWLAQLSVMNKVGGMESYSWEADLPEELYLHFVPFTQGMLYVGDTAPLAEDQIQIVKSLAEAFAIAYARYEDFRRLEEAKDKVETTLSELKAAQRQLIHAEKMASLGELTAGIAHEIQNPLNFINNFSEVSEELVKELEDALQTNKKEASALAEAVHENLQKINHHGKRAEAIVNGMLLHSRSTQGEKTLTDINALAEEYLRLSYHGLRAKDGSFQANFTTALDPAIEKRCVAPQDLGRALLNLFNNAFYAVNEKRQQTGEGYQPVVSLSTHKTGKGIEIAIADNGTGIPQRMLDKIFQPFFTTKPTGQGTGLGLSMSYDIIKGHGGDLLVETVEGEGTVFKIILPAKTN